MATNNNPILQSPDELPEVENTVINIVVVSEDTHIVRDYFEKKLPKLPFWKEAGIGYNPKVLRRKSNEGNQPKDIEDKIKKHIKSDKASDAEHYWLVIDRDITEVTDRLDALSEFCKNSKTTEGVKVNLANTNPCFAFWLFLHFCPAHDQLIENCETCEPIEKVLTSKEYPTLQVLRSRKRLKKDITLEMLKTAVNHAKAIPLSESHDDEWLKNPRTTQVHRIFLHHLPQIFR